jgi:hypothetical protein
LTIRLTTRLSGGRRLEIELTTKKRNKLGNKYESRKVDKK